jgi:phosphoribosylamine---glycine ligase
MSGTTTRALPAPARILVVGGGAREHALAWRLAGEPGVERVVVAPGNDAISALPRVTCAPSIRAVHGPQVAALAAREEVDLAVVGPEAPLAAGVGDALAAAGINVFGPTAAAARIESSKAFCRAVAEEAGVRIARGAAFGAGDEDAALAFAADLDRAGARVVVKADGLMAGKGVTVCDDLEAARTAIAALYGRAGPAGRMAPGGDGDGEPLVVLEERLEGREASVIALCDGVDAVALPSARDHKRLGDGDTGPNTGGMGAYAPAPDLPDDAVAAVVEAFHRPVLAALAGRGTPFRGALYAGLMLTADGPILLEFNARFGDPEAQVLLPLPDAPIGPLLLASARGRLGDATRALAYDLPVVPMQDAAAVAIVLASAGYPEAPRAGDAIEGLDAAAADGALVFHAGTTRDARGTWRTTGGRALTVVGLGADLAGARTVAERAAGRIRFDGMRRRTDIAALVPAAAVASAVASTAASTAGRGRGR